MSLTGSRRTLGDLQCVVVQSDDQPPRGLAVLCHGYGASAEDLVDLSAYLVQQQPAVERFRFVFPAAPIDLTPMGMPGGRAWWTLNMAALSQAVAARRFEELHQTVPPGIDVARGKLESTLQAAIAEFSEPPPVVLGGFSQGAMVTMDTTLRGTLPPPQLLVQWSGCLICEPLWKAAVGRLSDTTVMQAHGTVDTVLPFESGRALADLIDGHTAGGIFHRFDGPHTIDMASLDQVAGAMGDLIDALDEPAGGG